MATGFATSFTVVFVFAVLAGIAVLLGLIATLAVVLRRRSKPLPKRFHYVAIVLLIEVIGVAGFGFLWFLTEAPVAVAMLATLVLFPITAIGLRARWTTRLSRGGILTAVALAWGPSFLVGLLVFFGFTRAIEAVLVTGSSGSGLVGLGLFVAMSSGVAVVVGVGWLTSRLSRLLETRDTEGSTQEG